MRFPTREGGAMERVYHAAERYGSYIRFSNRENIPLNETLRLPSYFSPPLLFSWLYLRVSNRLQTTSAVLQPANYAPPPSTSHAFLVLAHPSFPAARLPTRVNVPVRDRWSVCPFVKKTTLPSSCSSNDHGTSLKFSGIHILINNMNA